MDQHKKRELDNQLLTMGLPGLNDPDLIQRLADLVSDFPGDRHEMFRDLLNEVDAEKRSECYNAMAPKLRFKALSLAQYECQIAERASQMVSQGRMRVEGAAARPIQVGREAYVKVPRRLADGAIATLYCHRCFKKKRYHADTPAGAMIKARKDGWTREPGIEKEICAKCAAKLAAHEVAVLSRDTVMVITDKRRVN